MEPKERRSLVNGPLKVAYWTPNDTPKAERPTESSKSLLIMRRNRSDFHKSDNIGYDITVKTFKPAFTAQRSARDLLASKIDRASVKVTQTPPILLKKRFHWLTMTEGQLNSGSLTPLFS